MGLSFLLECFCCEADGPCIVPSAWPVAGTDQVLKNCCGVNEGHGSGKAFREGSESRTGSWEFLFGRERKRTFMSR